MRSRARRTRTGPSRAWATSSWLRLARATVKRRPVRATNAPRPCGLASPSAGPQSRQLPDSPAVTRKGAVGPDLGHAHAHRERFDADLDFRRGEEARDLVIAHRAPEQRSHAAVLCVARAIVALMPRTHFADRHVVALLRDREGCDRIELLGDRTATRPAPFARAEECPDHGLAPPRLAFHRLGHEEAAGVIVEGGRVGTGRREGEGSH